MRPRSVWELDADDEPLIDRLAAGVGRTPARLLAYLLLRAEREDEPTTSVQLQVGTGVNRTTVGEAMGRLEARDLVERTTVRPDEADSAGGRPRTAWRPVADVDATVEVTYAGHATALLERAGTDGADGNGDEDQNEGPTPNVHGTDREPPSTDPAVEIGLNWRPNALHVPFYAAMAADWYEPFGVEIGLEHCDGSERALEALASGRADLAVAGAATVVRARARGAPIVPVAVCYQRAMTVLYTTREAFGEALEGVDQLVGRRIGMPPDSETRLLGRLFLSQTGVDDGDDVRIVDTNGEEREALRTGAADVVTGSFADPRALERTGRTVDTLLLTDHFPIYGPTLVAHERTLESRPAAVAGVLAGTTGGWAAARRDPRPAAERIAAASNNDPERIRETFERAAAEFGEGAAVRERGWGWHRPAMWDRLLTALEQGAMLRDVA